MSDREIDHQLVQRAQKGDKRAFEMLVIDFAITHVQLLPGYRYCATFAASRPTQQHINRTGAFVW